MNHLTDKTFAIMMNNLSDKIFSEEETKAIVKTKNMAQRYLNFVKKKKLKNLHKEFFDFFIYITGPAVGRLLQSNISDVDKNVIAENADQHYPVMVFISVDLSSHFKNFSCGVLYEKPYVYINRLPGLNFWRKENLNNFQFPVLSATYNSNFSSFYLNRAHFDQARSNWREKDGSTILCNRIMGNGVTMEGYKDFWSRWSRGYIFNEEIDQMIFLR